MFVLDASGSMRGQVDGKAKIEVAHSVLQKLAADLPAGTRAGLIAYGHRRDGCDDIELVLPFAPLDRKAFSSQVERLKPVGSTPLTAATEQAIAQAKQSGKATTIVLITDGLETCRASPCDAVKKAQAAGVKFALHIVGFDIKDNTDALRCAAERSGGRYFDARNTAELTAALEQATVPIFGTLKLRATHNGAKLNCHVEVVNNQTHVVAAQSATDTGKPCTYDFEVPAGDYTVSISDRNLAQYARETRPVTVVAGHSATLDYDSESGIVKLAARSKDQPVSAMFEVKSAGKVVCSGALSKEGATCALRAGPHRVEMWGVPGNPSFRNADFTVTKGQTVEQTLKW